MRLTDPLDLEGKRKGNSKDVSRWQDKAVASRRRLSPGQELAWLGLEKK